MLCARDHGCEVLGHVSRACGVIFVGSRLRLAEIIKGKIEMKNEMIASKSVCREVEVSRRHSQRVVIFLTQHKLRITALVNVTKEIMMTIILRHE